MDYLTVAAPVRAEFIEKRSRFIASVSPCNDENEAMQFVNKIKAEFHDARHNCFAFIIKDGAERFSDDGEPQGTAGMPILEVVRRRNLVNTVVVVTRYFGGILLGAPGLVRAYNHTASIGIDNAELSNMCLCDVLKLTITYDFYSQAEILVRNFDGIINNRDFTENVNLIIYMKKANTEGFKRALTQASSGRFSYVLDGEVFIAEKAQ